VQDALDDSGAALSLARQRLDSASVDRDEAELSGDEQTVGDDEEQDGQQTERGIDRLNLLSASTNQVQ